MKTKSRIGLRRRLLLMPGLLLLLFVSPVLAQSSLKSRRDYVVGDHPTGFVIADYDADGFLDLITFNDPTVGDGDIALVKGFMDGTFRRVAAVISGSVPTGLVYADADNDGKADLIVSNWRSLEVAVHPGNGVGGFAPKISTLLATPPTSLVVGDWNKDGKKDVALLSGAQNSVVIRLGDGSGRFPTSRQTFSVGTNSKMIVNQAVTLPDGTTVDADFNKDGNLDLAVVNGGANAVQIFRGDGTGLFTLNATLATGSGPLAVAIADFNADTRLDLAVANFAADSVSVFLGTTTGGFGSPSALSPGSGPRGLAVGDLNKDGKLDLVVTLGKISQEGQVALMLGTGTGGFTLSNTLFVGPGPNIAALADFNRDGNLDVVTANYPANTVSILQSTGTATFLIPGRISVPFGSFPDGIAVGDFNRDGKPDVITANEQTNNVSIVTGDGACGSLSINSTNNTGITPISMVAGNFNGDLCPDLVTANNGDGTYTLMQGNCAGNFTVTNGNVVGCLDPIAVSTGDINGDGHLDMAIACETSGDLCVRPGTGTTNPVFGPAVCTPAVTKVAEGLAVGPYTLDAFADYALTSSAQLQAGETTNVISIAKSDGTGGVTEIPATFPVGVGPRGIVTGDLNGDGYLDLVLANTSSGTVSALLGDGGGVFSFPSIDSPAGQGPAAIALADYNLDGRLDAAVVNAGANNVSLLLGDGLGHFTKAGDYGTRDLPLAIGVFDCNNDGKPDLAVADNFNDTVTILVNQTVPGDPLAFTTLFGQTRTVFSWGVVGGATYDVIRGQVKSVTQGATSFNLGPVVCLANDLVETDTAASPDSANPPSGDAFFYAVRSVVGEVPGNYTVSVPSGKAGVPSSGGCP